MNTPRFGLLDEEYTVESVKAGRVTLTRSEYFTENPAVLVYSWDGTGLTYVGVEDTTSELLRREPARAA